MVPGYGAAEAALESGANVYIGSSNAERVESAVKSLESDNASGKGSIQGRAIDLKSDESVKEFVDWVAGDTKGGGEQGVDHLIFTAGDALMLGDLMDTNLEEAKAVSLVVAIHLPDLPLIQLGPEGFRGPVLGRVEGCQGCSPCNERSRKIWKHYPHFRTSSLWKQHMVHEWLIRISEYQGTVAYKPAKGWSIASGMGGSVEVCVSPLASSVFVTDQFTNGRA
jgi:NAD(P)-dependent dehydrogenase (short-subunit alcohol dehydrogenase family)